MVMQSDLSHEFASLVKQLHKTPDEPTLKQKVVKLIPEMKVLAKTNPLDLYRLAHIHHPASQQYRHMMMESAAKGCTNAMLALVQELVKSDLPVDLATAAHYTGLIERSQDSYIIKQVRNLLKSCPEVTALMKTEFKSDSYNIGLRFFTALPETQARRELEMTSRPGL